MSYTASINLVLGTSKIGLSLVAQLINTAGSSVGSSIHSGFIEIGQGNYIWTYDQFPDGFRGGIKFFDQANPSIVLAFVAINPEEIEQIAKINQTITSPPQNLEIKVSNPVNNKSINIQTGVR